MYKRDLITVEIQKLAQVLAKILGLKIELQLDEAELLFQQTLEKDFGLPNQMLYAPDLVPFEEWLAHHDLLPEKLEMLSQFIFSEIDATASKEKNKSLAQKLTLIYQILMAKYHIVHLINLDRQKQINQFL